MTDIIKAARALHDKGYAVVAIPELEKNPGAHGRKEWQSFRVTDDASLVAEFSDVRGNVGILNGTPSNDRIDVDCDCDEAVKLAPQFIPATATFGRQHNRRSHFIIECTDGAPDTKSFVGPDKDMIVELRSTGSQSIAPGSKYKGKGDERSYRGEPIEWDDDREPCQMTQQQALDTVSKLAIASLLLRNWKAGSKDVLATAVCGLLLRAGWGPERTNKFVQIISVAAGDDDVDAKLKADKLLANDRLPGFTKLVEVLGNAAAEKITQWLKVSAKEQMDAFVIRDTDKHLTVRRAHEVLTATGTVFRRAGELVRPVTVKQVADDLHDGIKRNPDSLIIYSLTPMWLSTILTEHGQWAKFNAKDERIAIGFPDKEAQRLVEVKDAQTEPVLLGISECPIVRADGSICTAAGYDSQSRMWLRDNFIDVPDITPDAGTDVHASELVAQAHIALAWLDEIVFQFPFVTPADKSVALAAMLTIPIRHRMSCCPAFCFDASTPGSGKSLLADIIGTLATGRRPKAQTYPEDDEQEAHKILGATLRTGDPIIFFDNIHGTVEGATLSMVLTQPSHSFRVLGVSQMLNLPTNALMLMDGNNMQFSKEIFRRVLRCRIVHAVADPAGIEYRIVSAVHDADRTQSEPCPPILDAVTRNRAMLMGCILTIWRAWHAVGRPTTKLQEDAEYRDFGDVRQILVWLGLDDPLLTRAAAAAEVQEDATGRDLLLELSRVFEDRRWTTKEAQAAMVDRRMSVDACRNRHGVPDPLALPYVLRSLKDVAHSMPDGSVMTLKAKLDKDSGVNMWVIEGGPKF
jgi:hypothetical protein